jgi:hypothetical protein
MPMYSDFVCSWITEAGAVMMKHIARSPTLVLFVLAVPIIGWPEAATKAQDRQPSPMECECALEQGNYRTNTNVDNASLCIQQINGQSCRVTVHCLVTGQGPGCEAKFQTEDIATRVPGTTSGSFADVDPQVGRDFINILMGLLNNHFEFQSDADLPIEETQRIARQLLEGASNDLLACAQQYAGWLNLPELYLYPEQYRVLAESIADLQFFCGVDAETGWLQIGFFANDRFFLIQFAPLG